VKKSFEQQENNVGVFSFEFTADEFKEAMNWAYKRRAKQFNVPGFRKGKAPMAIALSYYGEGVLYDTAIDHIIAPAYEEAVEEYDAKPVSQPEFDIVEIGMDKGLKCNLTVDTEPVPELGEYKGVEAVKPSAEVTDEDVDAELGRIQERNSRMVPVEDRAAEEDDTANIDYTGYVDGEEFEGGKAEGHDLVLGSGSFIPGFEDQIIGKNVGDSFDVNVTFPEEYHADDLAGKEAVFKVTLNSLKKKELPALDDDFAMDVSEFDTFAEYKDSVRKELEEAAENRAQSAFENNVLEKVVDNAKFDIPHSMIHNEMDQILRYQQQQMRSQGIELEQYLGFLGQNMDQYRMTLHEPAERNIRVQLVLAAIAEKENIALTDEEKQAEIKTLAEQTGLSEEEVERQIGGNSIFFENAKNEKTIHFLTDHAVAVDEPEPTEEETAEDAATEEVEGGESEE
jgi:trigger factor